ncbi:MAG: hypothetical protein IRY95_04105, partial [Clostridia bacterium]|nr:hypothetical protein [Clostridia bacterium]
MAVVAVDVPGPLAARLYDYRVPPSLRGLIEPGHQVWVPFGRRRVRGFVVALRDRPAVASVRDVVAVGGLPLPPVVLDLAQWLARTYVSPLVDALRCAAPVLPLRRGGDGGHAAGEGGRVPATSVAAPVSTFPLT